MTNKDRPSKRERHGAPRRGESELIARYFAPLTQDPGARGLLDDAASLSLPPGQEIVLTVDAVVAGVHFPEAEDAGAVARKALRVNLSDLAAKGAEPIGYLVSLALRDDWTEAWLESFVAGLGADQAEFGLSLYGGDTVRTPGPLSVSITAFGQVAKGRMVERGAARPGDVIFVSGSIGDAALGLLVRQSPELASRWDWRRKMRCFCSTAMLVRARALNSRKRSSPAPARQWMSLTD